MSALNFDDHDIPGFKPVIGGLRHLTFEGARPPAGIVVDLLCGGRYRVSTGQKSKPLYDCHACMEVWLEQRPQTPVAQPAAPPPSQRLPLGGRALTPGAADGIPNLSAAPGLHLAGWS